MHFNFSDVRTIFRTMILYIRAKNWSNQWILLFSTTCVLAVTLVICILHTTALIIILKQSCTGFLLHIN